MNDPDKDEPPLGVRQEGEAPPPDPEPEDRSSPVERSMPLLPPD